jgi:hypothetical protein
MHFQVPWYIEVIGGYLIAFFMFSKMGHHILLGLFHGQVNPPSRKRKR